MNNVEWLASINILTTYYQLVYRVVVLVFTLIVFIKTIKW